MKSLALVVNGHHGVTLEQQELAAPGPGQLLIQTAYSTLSPGTERSIILGSHFPRPTGIGYSLAGHVTGIGAGVTRFALGDEVVAVAPHASHVVVDERAAIRVPAGADLEQAAFFTLAHTALYGIRQARPQLGEAIAVIGQGIVGLLAARLALLAGGLPVIAIDIDERRLDLSRKLGIHQVVNGADATRLQAIMEGLPGGGAPVVIEVTGVRAPLQQALDIVSVRGRIVLLGTTHGDETVQFHRALSWKGAALIGAYVNSKPWDLQQSDMEIKTWPPSIASGHRAYQDPGIFSSSDDVRVILELLKYGSLDLGPLITDRFSPQQAEGAYHRVIAQDSTLVGGVIHWR